MADVYWIYEGVFTKGKYTGQGRTIQGGRSDYPGYIYNGRHEDGYAHGDGTSYRNDGQIREDGTREDGTREYEGQWENDCWRGVGTLYRPDGSISRNGTWVNGDSGEYEWQEGKRCIGTKEIGTRKDGCTAGGYCTVPTARV